MVVTLPVRVGFNTWVERVRAFNIKSKDKHIFSSDAFPNCITIPLKIKPIFKLAHIKRKCEEKPSFAEKTRFLCTKS